MNILLKGFGKGVHRAASIGFGVVAFAGIGFPLASSAAVISPGGNLSPVTNIAIAGLPAGDTLANSESLPYTATDANSVPVFQGTITSYVFNDPSEPDTGQPGEDFVYQVTNGAPPVGAKADAFTEVTFLPFNNYLTDVNYEGTGSGVAPTSADRSAAPGKNVDYFFSSGVANGQQTYQLVIETDATQYMQGAGLVLDGGGGSQFAYAPTAEILTVPEPASLVMLVLGGTFALSRRRRQ